MDEIEALPSPVIQRQERPVEAWLAATTERKRSAILSYAETESSFVISYLYASMLGLPCSVDDWQTFVGRRWQKLDRRAILDSEVMALHSDIGEIRQAVIDGKIRLGDSPTKISYLSRELRGHIEQLSKEALVTDRRSLLLAGVETAGKFLKKSLGHDARAWPAVEASLEAAWADVESKNQL